jgi:hypothetical protein
MIKQCQFETRFKHCEPPSRVIVTNIYEIKDWISLSQFIFSIGLLPFSCIFSIILNILTIVAIQDMWLANKKAAKPDTNSILNYMWWNAIFSLLFSLLFALKPLTICIDFVGIYCSPIYTSVWTQYFKIIGLNYAGTVLEMCSNLTSLLLSIERYSVIEPTSKYLGYFRQTTHKRMIKLSVAFSLVFCLVKGFE